MGGAVNLATGVVKSVVGGLRSVIAPALDLVKSGKVTAPGQAPAPATSAAPAKLGDAAPSAVTEAEAARKRVANSLLQGAGRGAATEDKLGG